MEQKKKGAGGIFKSKYFYYKGFSYEGVPLLRYDDPGNMNYGATGKVFFKMLGDGGLGEFFLEDFAAQGYSLRKTGTQGNENLHKLEKFGYFLKNAKFDDEKDQASIRFGFYNFQYHVSAYTPKDED